MNDSLEIMPLGVVPYAEAWDVQRRLRAEVAAGERSDALILLEHPHVYTLGRRGSEDDILADDAALQELGVEIRHTDRGGEVTYHGPGQLVGYPIVNLRRLGGGPLKYVRSLERALTATLAQFDIRGESEGRPTGVWVRDRKIASIGVKIAGGVTTHGFALNVCPDLSYFDHIVACGIPEARATSMARELARPIHIEEVAPTIAATLSEALETTIAKSPTQPTPTVIPAKAGIQEGRGGGAQSLPPKRGKARMGVITTPHVDTESTQ